MPASASNNLKNEIKQWLKHKKIVFETGHGYEKQKELFEYVWRHLELTDWNLKMVKVMSGKLKELLPHEANTSFANQQRKLDEILNQINAAI
jgi:hypothetical protein